MVRNGMIKNRMRVTWLAPAQGSERGRERETAIRETKKLSSVQPANLKELDLQKAMACILQPLERLLFGVTWMTNQ
jgi:hypothetical protein